jgi:hypothetical protein
MHYPSSEKLFTPPANPTETDLIFDIPSWPTSLPPLPLVDDCLFIDNSMMELFTTCNRAMLYNRLMKRTLSDEKAALSFGGAIHHALEYRYKVWRNKPLTQDCLDAQSQILRQWFNNKPTPVGDHRSLNFAIEVMERYNNQYSLEPFSLLEYTTPQRCSTCKGKREVDMTTGYPLPDEPTPDQTSAFIGVDCLFCSSTGLNSTMIELPFSLELCRFRGPDARIFRVMYCGRIDLPVLWDTAMTIIDHKTASMLGNSFFESLAMSAQQKGYCYSFTKTTGIKVRQFAVNALRVRQPPIKVQTSASAANAWWQENLVRQRFDVSDEQLLEWEWNVKELISEFLWNYSRGYFPMKTSWCAKFGKCQYYDVCSLPVAQREELLSSTMYQDNLWSPLH